MDADTKAVWLDENHITTVLEARGIEDTGLVTETLAKA